jgi:hypothetical protein
MPREGVSSQMLGASPHPRLIRENADVRAAQSCHESPE